MSDARDEARRAVIAAGRRLLAERLVHATAGNVSCRVAGEPGLLALTPTGRPFDELEPDDIALVTAAGEQLAGRGRPTSELPLHTAIYARRPEVGAIVHTHSQGAMTLAALGWELPPILTGLVEAAGGAVRCAPYARPTTAALADVAVEALDGRGACLLRHHGLLAIGATLGHALRAASVTEATCRAYLAARAQGVDVPALDPAEVEAMAAWWRAQWEPPAA